MPLFISNEFNDWTGVKVKNLLCFGYNICFEDRVKSNNLRPGNTETKIFTQDSDKVKVYPNPGNLYVIFDISLSLAEVPAIITISDLTGKSFAQITVTEPLCQKIFDLRNLPNSVYEYSIQGNGKNIQSGKITVNH